MAKTRRLRSGAPSEPGANWYGDDFTTQLKGQVKKRLRRVAKLGQKTLKQLISVPNAKVTTITNRKTGKARRKITDRGSQPSKPGQPPRKLTGALAGSTYSVVLKKRLASRYGVRMPHGMLMERGRKTPTNVMLPRPFREPVKRRIASEAARILGESIQGAQ
jgi:hypothetical protein